MTAPWWHETTMYQIYPRSFCDSNGDGIGDLRGIIGKLDYIAELGFETIWISPVYPSPLADHGYDISDYHGVAPEYGTPGDLEELIAAAHRRDLKVLLDLVLNHTSVQHPWFVESRSSRDNAKSDWYLWRDGRAPGRPPNNWIAMPGGRGWHYDRRRDQWYMASFLPFQPDLNWRNPEVKQAMFDVVRHWLRRGVDGFRLDMFSAVMKDPQFRDNPFSPDLCAGLYDGLVRLRRPVRQINHPDCFALARELRQVAAEFDEPERILVGEVSGDLVAHRELLGIDRNDGFHLVFLFDFAGLLPWQRTAKWFRSVLAAFERYFPPPFQPTYVFGSHDLRRLMSRIGDDLELGRVLALLQLTARGVPTVYMGEEIAMTDRFIARADAQDPVSAKYGFVPDWLREWLPVNLNRDKNRTPMQWTPQENAGFCPDGVRPWLPVNARNKADRNVTCQLYDPGSMLNWYRALLHLRKSSAALRSGRLRLLDGLPPTVLGYVREGDGERIGVLINFARRAVSFDLPGAGQTLLASAPQARAGGGRVSLGGRSGLVLRC